jgi:hypothetical protein
MRSWVSIRALATLLVVAFTQVIILNLMVTRTADLSAAAESKHLSPMRPVRESSFCGRAKNSQWRQIRRSLPVAPNGGIARGSYQTERPPQYFCDKMQSSIEPWVVPAQLSQHDLAVGIFTGEMLKYGQVIAQRDTWLGRVSASYTFAPTSDQQIPLHGLEMFELQPDYVNKRTTQLVNLYAMKRLYDLAPDKKW